MAKHSSFENLVALETYQNFFLIAGISTDELRGAEAVNGGDVSHEDKISGVEASLPIPPEN